MRPTWPGVHQVGLTSTIWHQPWWAGHADWFWANRLDPEDMQCTPMKKCNVWNYQRKNMLLCGCYEESSWKHLRLCRSKSSVSKSRRGCCTSEGPWDWRTDDEEEMTVVWPEGWIVLNWNWGPIQRRRWGPVWVTISTLGEKSSGS